MAMSWEEIANERMREINRLRSVVRSCNGIIDRKNEMLFDVIEHARGQANKTFGEWKDADDWLFSELDITKQELEEIYEGRGVMVYGGSCADGNGPQAEQDAPDQDGQGQTQSF